MQGMSHTMRIKSTTAILARDAVPCSARTRRITDGELLLLQPLLLLDGGNAQRDRVHLDTSRQCSAVFSVEGFLGCHCKRVRCRLCQWHS